jgi:hypothetical protein
LHSVTKLLVYDIYQPLSCNISFQDYLKNVYNSFPVIGCGSSNGDVMGRLSSSQGVKILAGALLKYIKGSNLLSISPAVFIR